MRSVSTYLEVVGKVTIRQPRRKIYSTRFSLADIFTSIIDLFRNFKGEDLLLESTFIRLVDPSNEISCHIVAMEGTDHATLAGTM